MGIKELINKLKDVSSSQPNVNYVGVGNVYDLNSTPDVNYSTVYITYQSTSIDEVNKNHIVNLFYIDRLTDGFDNKLDIQNDGITTLTNIINTIVYTEDIEISYPLSFTPFNERFADECAGVFVTATFVIDGDGSCYYS